MQGQPIVVQGSSSQELMTSALTNPSEGCGLRVVRSSKSNQSFWWLTVSGPPSVKKNVTPLTWMHPCAFQLYSTPSPPSTQPQLNSTLLHMVCVQCTNCTCSPLVGTAVWAQLSKLYCSGAILGSRRIFSTGYMLPLRAINSSKDCVLEEWRSSEENTKVSDGSTARGHLPEVKYVKPLLSLGGEGRQPSKPGTSASLHLIKLH